ncbi:FMN-binding protein [Desulfomarina sp.]
MKDIITIVMRLTVSCLLAATVIGLTFIFTSNAKKHNEHVKEQQVMYELLGYRGDMKVPDSVSMHEIYRYIVSGRGKQSIAYLVPAGHDEGDFYYVNIDLDGRVLETRKVKLTEAEALEAESRNRAVAGAAGTGFDVHFADQTIIVTDNGKRIAYLLSGKFPGFKTFISVMLALDPRFGMLGMEILEHEEDPGLGAEIEQDYFKNQFMGKPFEALKKIGVVKEPLPDEYRAALEGKVGQEEILKIRQKYQDKDIYALTGATISSRSVSNGVKAIVRKFAYRVGILDKVLKEQQLDVPF